ncbi:MAG: glycosyltransferase [Parcubacteria group bacterium]|jgi:glycosyltransferase involved in cell wall biosynthesis
MDIKNIKIAIVHDFLNQYGGAERVLEILHEIFPEAPIYTLLYEKEKMRGKLENAEIRTSFLQKFPKWIRRRHKWLLPLMPTAPETFNFRDYDLVISSSSAFAKGIVIKPKTIHVCYCHSPMRYTWDWNENYLAEQGLGRKRRIFARMILNYVRIWDRVAADRADYFIANSRATQARIKKYYGRESRVIYPPVDIGSFEVSPREARGFTSSSGDYFLIVSRLAPYKKIDVAIEALNKLNLPLVIVGEGPEKYQKYLKKIAGPKTRFLGWLPDEKIHQHYGNCRAFLFPGEDDFGITPIEAMSHGKPVIALRRGGAVETIIEGETGEFFDDASIEVMVDALRRFIEHEETYDPEKIRVQSENFSKEIFVENIKKMIQDIPKES